MNVKIDKSLKLVIPMESDDGKKFYVHSSVMSRAVFEQFFLVVSKAFSEIYTQGLGVTSGPRIAALMLRRAAKDLDVEAEVETGLINEMKRLTNVIVPGQNGWETLPFEQAVSGGWIDDESASEVENALAFFSLASAMHRRTEREPILTAAAALWGGQITSSPLTEYIRSLPISTATGNSGVTTTAA